MSDDLRQGVTPAGHAVLDRADETRASLECCEMESLLSMAAKSAGAARSGDLEGRRRSAVAAASLLLLAVERIDEDLAR